MEKPEKYQELRGLTEQLAQNLECLRDALTDLSLSLKDSAMDLHPDLAQAAATLAEQTLQRCAMQSLAPRTPRARD